MIEGTYYRLSDNSSAIVICNVKHPPKAIAVTTGDFVDESTTTEYFPRQTCHIVKAWSDSDYDEDWRYRCSECECPFPVNERNPRTGDVISAANYCPNCGARRK